MIRDGVGKEQWSDPDRELGRGATRKKKQKSTSPFKKSAKHQAPFGIRQTVLSSSPQVGPFSGKVTVNEHVY